MNINFLTTSNTAHFLLITLSIISFTVVHAQDNVIALTVSAAHDDRDARIPLFVGVSRVDAHRLGEFMKVLKTDLERSKQYNLVIEDVRLPKDASDITKLAARDFMMAFFISCLPNGRGIEWRLYDTSSARMIKGRKVETEGAGIDAFAHGVANEMWQQLAGKRGPFTAKIAYVQSNPKSRSQHDKQVKLMVCDYDGTHHETLLDAGGVSVAPYWGLNPQHPFIVYSDFTPRNVRLVSIDLTGRRRVVADFDGTLAGVSFHPSGDLIYGRSGNLWKYHYDTSTGRGIHTMVVREPSTASNPTLLANGDIIYAAGGRIKRYHAGTETKTIVRDGGYHAGPAVHEPTQKLVFSRRMGKTFELFLYDLKSGKERQLTHGPGDKTDPAWAPEGVWIAYTLEQGSTAQIFALNTLTGATYLITPEGKYCRYPAWSPLFDGVPYLN